MINNKLKRQKR